MKTSQIFTGVLILSLCWACSGTPSPTTSASPASSPVAVASPQASATPEATATPTPDMPTVNLTSEEGISGMQKLIDDQVSEGILVRSAVEKDNMLVRSYKGAAGVRRVNVTVTHAPDHKEEITYWCYEGKVISFGGNGKKGDESYFYWAGISPDGTLQMPFKKVGGKSADFPEDEIRKRQADGQKLLDEVSG